MHMCTRARRLQNDSEMSRNTQCAQPSTLAIMKLRITLLGIASALATSVVFAQTETTTTITTTTTTGTGTITEYSPGSAFVVKETSGPVSYHYGDKVTYVTRSGKDLTDDEVRTPVKVGAPVSVQYSTQGSDRIISRIQVDDD